MSIIKVDYGEITGGGTVKTGTVDDTTQNDQTITINTGLTLVNKFSIFGNSPNYDGNSLCMTTFDRAMYGDSVYRASMVYGTSTSGGGMCGRGNIGERVSFAGIYTFKIESINGGTITLKSPTRTEMAVINNIYWYAE